MTSWITCLWIEGFFFFFPNFEEKNPKDEEAIYYA